MNAEKGKKELLFVVKDKLAGARITGVIPAKSFALAVFGFMQFCESEVEQKKLPKRNYDLVYVGSIDDNGELDDTAYYHVVCNGEEASEKFDQLQQEIFDSEVC